MDNKQKNAKVNKILAISLTVLLCAAAVIAAIATTQNRAKTDGVTTTAPPVTTRAPELTRAPITTNAPETTSTPSGLDVPDTTSPPETTGTVVTPGDGNYDDDVDLPAPALPTFSVPVKGSVSKGHDNMTAVYSATMDDWRVHLGLDIAAAEGSDVKAAADGTVSQVWDDPLMGKCVSIAHTGAGVSIYKNLDPELPVGITVGARVSAGDVIGAVGESAIIEVADEPHLHFELTVSGEHVDPMEYLDPASVKDMLSEDVYE